MRWIAAPSFVRRLVSETVRADATIFCSIASRAVIEPGRRKRCIDETGNCRSAQSPDGQPVQNVE